jgi:hypothetical protein
MGFLFLNHGQGNAMVDAIWSIRLVSSDRISGIGIVVLEAGRIFGGDPEYYYVGTYRAAHGMVYAAIVATPYEETPCTTVDLVAESFRVELSGRIDKPKMELRGHLEGDPSRRIRLECTWKADLP